MKRAGEKDELELNKKLKVDSSLDIDLDLIAIPPTISDTELELIEKGAIVTMDNVNMIQVNENQSIINEETKEIEPNSPLISSEKENLVNEKPVETPYFDATEPENKDHDGTVDMVDVIEKNPGTSTDNADLINATIITETVAVSDPKDQNNSVVVENNNEIEKQNSYSQSVGESEIYELDSDSEDEILGTNAKKEVTNQVNTENKENDTKNTQDDKINQTNEVNKEHLTTKPDEKPQVNTNVSVTSILPTKDAQLIVIDDDDSQDEDSSNNNIKKEIKFKYVTINQASKPTSISTTIQPSNPAPMIAAKPPSNPTPMIIAKQPSNNTTPIITTKPPSKSTPMTTTKHQPVRQSRSKITTYNDVENSIDPKLFENEFASDGEDDIDSASIPEYHSQLYHKVKITKLNSTAESKLNQWIQKPLGKRRLLKTGFVYDTVMSYHATSDPMEIHPEDPSRIFRIFNIIERHKLLSECKRIKSRRATKQEILLVHNIKHYRKLRETSDFKSRAEYMAMENKLDSVYLNSNSFESALYAVGSLINLLEAVVKNEIKNAFAIIRPPGHHAETDMPMGFCLFNNVAISTKDCMNRLGVKKVLIVDWDIHFGNGTQNIFAEDPNVLYISLHRFEDASFYPSDVKGSVSYTGYRKGEGKTVNIPWPCAGMTDADYIYAFQEVVMPIAVEFDPDVVIVSAGFDAALNDPIGKCNVTPAGYGHMTHMLKSLANGKLVIALEGGYNVDSIAVSALACMNILLGESPDSIESGLVPKKECIDTIGAVKDVQKKYWKCIN